jgi:hypothetical protein
MSRIAILLIMVITAVTVISFVSSDSVSSAEAQRSADQLLQVRSGDFIRFKDGHLGLVMRTSEGNLALGEITWATLNVPALHGQNEITAVIPLSNFLYKRAQAEFLSTPFGLQGQE